MKGYLIKSTYLTGPHKGKSYLLRKGGYVTEEGNSEWCHTTYKTLALAKRRCRQLDEDNEIDYNIETREMVRSIQQGKLPSLRIYERKRYEPYIVEIVGYTSINRKL